jgi:phthalate 4,5-cis-dihydrodiol dehydrogenase
MDRKLRLGVAGLGRGFMLMLPTLTGDPRLELVAAADPRAEARARFATDFGGRAYATIDELCRDAAVEAIYIATPHQFHAAHAIAAATARKHVLVEKPMALTLDECRSMVDAARTAGVHLVVGHSHSFDAPIAETRRLIAAGAFGKLRMITALNYTDFLYRPRRPEELDTAQGGGVVFSQAAHQIDIVRLLAGGMTRSVRAATGRWDPKRPTEGAYTAFLDFADGASATISYSGYGGFDSDELCGWIGETGLRKEGGAHDRARRLSQLAGGAEAEAALKAARAYGGTADSSTRRGSPAERRHEHFGFILASCEKADLRPMPHGVMIYGDDGPVLHPLAPPRIPRVEVIDELYAAVVEGREPLRSGAWGMATMEVCLALLQSAGEGREIALSHQVPVPAAA